MTISPVRFQAAFYSVERNTDESVQAYNTAVGKRDNTSLMKFLPTGEIERWTVTGKDMKYVLGLLGFKVDNPIFFEEQNRKAFHEYLAYNSTKDGYQHVLSTLQAYFNFRKIAKAPILDHATGKRIEELPVKAPAPPKPRLEDFDFNTLNVVA